MELDGTGEGDVPDAESVRDQAPRHEQAAVALKRVALGAHENRPALLSKLRHALDAAAEFGCLSHERIARNAIDHELFSRGAPSEEAPGPAIPKPGSGGRDGECALLELGVPARDGVRPHVDELGAAGSANVIEEDLDRMVRMTDRENVVGRHGRSIKDCRKHP